MISIGDVAPPVKPRPNDRDMPTTQHIATSLSATCCVRLATVLRYVATFWVFCLSLKIENSKFCMLLAQAWKFKLEPTTYKIFQHGSQTHATCCAQQCCDMLRWHVAIVWPGLKGYSPVLHCASLLRIILRVISAGALKNGGFSLRLDLAKEVNRHFLENERGHLSFFSVVLNWIVNFSM